MPGLRVRCPAKLNLSLRVGPRDDRGYHPIQTLFQAIDLGDEMLVRPAELPSFRCDSPWVPPENTVTKAIRLLGEIAMVPPLAIELIKRVPPESGLGAGSSDAAGLIRAINHVLPSPISDDHLFDVAAAIGADVPFFLVGGRALGEGYGERLTPLPDRVTEWYVVVRPSAGVSTKDAYQMLDELRLAAIEGQAELFHNDFERVMPCECAKWIDRLMVHGAIGAALTGSGSAVYGLFGSREGAEQAAGKLRMEASRPGDLPVWVTRSLSKSESLHIESL